MGEAYGFLAAPDVRKLENRMASYKSILIKEKHTIFSLHLMCESSKIASLLNREFMQHLRLCTYGAEQVCMILEKNMRRYAMSATLHVWCGADMHTSLN